MTPQQFYMMHGTRDMNRITIRSNMKRALSILWCRGGEYRLVPKEVVQNAIESVEIYNKMAGKRMINPQVCIYWNQGVPVNNQIGRMLSGE